MTQERSTALNYVGRTAQNSPQSPLLRLPGELRNKIWAYAYGDKYVVAESLSELHSKSWAPDLVCKQYWAEAWPIYIDTATFVFAFAGNLTKFASSGSTLVGKVRRLSVVVSMNIHSLGEQDPKTWERTLSQYLMRELTRVEGLELQLTSMPGVWNSLLPHQALVHPVMVISNLTAMIQSLQQFKWKEEHTNVRVTISKARSWLGHQLTKMPEAEIAVWAKELEDVITGHLLDYKGCPLMGDASTQV